MAEPRLSNILIGVLFVGLFALAIAIFVGKGVTDYSVSGYDNTTLEPNVDFTVSGSGIVAIIVIYRPGEFGIIDS